MTPGSEQAVTRVTRRIHHKAWSRCPVTHNQSRSLSTSFRAAFVRAPALSPGAMQAAAAGPLAALQQQCDPAQVLQLLLAALSHDQAVQKQAEQTLQSLEGQTGYASCLAVSVGPADRRPRACCLPAIYHSDSEIATRIVDHPRVQAIVANGDANHSARWMASVQLKNAISKHWRPRYDSRYVPCTFRTAIALTRCARWGQQRPPRAARHAAGGLPMRSSTPASMLHSPGAYPPRSGPTCGSTSWASSARKTARWACGRPRRRCQPVWLTTVDQHTAAAAFGGGRHGDMRQRAR